MTATTKAESLRVFTLATRTLRRSLSTGRRLSDNSRSLHEFNERVGPIRVFDGSATPLEYFQLFYSDVVFGKIADFTNGNARNKFDLAEGEGQGDGVGRRDIRTWKAVTVVELKAYYGLLFLMEVMKFDRLEMYWATSSAHWLVGSAFGEVMSRDRFTQIKKYLHFSDDSGPRNADKLHKVRYVLDECRRSFQAEYTPHREVAIDEAMVPFKGRLGMKQYMRDKPVKFGIKMWIAAESVSAYCHNFDVYVGKSNTVVNATFGLASKVVVDLTRPLLKKGHVIYTDNFYTSPQLADYLYTQDTYLCGTVRTNRKGYPKQLVPSSAVARRMPRGSSDWLMCGPLLASYWKDNRIVFYLSTFHSPEGDELVTTRRSKDGTQLQLDATPTQQAYAKYMAGVDRLDQNTKVNRSRKSLRWYRKVEMKLRECALYNAYVIESTVVEHNRTRQRKRDLLSFRLDVAHGLIGKTVVTSRPFKRPRSDCHDEARLDEMGHWPTGAGGTNRVCVVCNKKHRNYLSSHRDMAVKDVPYKRTKTTMACVKCDVPLCCNARSTCYRDFHTKVYYWQ